MDAFLLKQVVAELSAALPGALVSRVHQPADKEIVLTLWTGREEKRLLLSADPENCRLHLTTRKSPNPAVPPLFCQYLRRHMEGMRIASFALAPYDRSVRIDFRSSRPDAEHECTSLHAELFGRHANLIYVDGEGTILFPLRVVSPEESRIREISPGLPYRPLPRPARVFLPEVTPEDAARIHAGGAEGLARALQDSVAGLGREVAHEAAARGKESPEVAVFRAQGPGAPVRGKRFRPRRRDAARTGSAGSSPSPAPRRDSRNSSRTPPPTTRRTSSTRAFPSPASWPCSASSSPPASRRC